MLQFSSMKKLFSIITVNLQIMFQDQLVSVGQIMMMYNEWIRSHTIQKPTSIKETVVKSIEEPFINWCVTFFQKCVCSVLHQILYVKKINTVIEAGKKNDKIPNVLPQGLLFGMKEFVTKCSMEENCFCHFFKGWNEK